ncbi:MAG: hypothetical protein ACT4O5_12850 [Gammaproteobacteria bacterium]
MHKQKQSDADLEKLADLIEESRIAMLTTAEPDGTLRSRGRTRQRREAAARAREGAGDRRDGRARAQREDFACAKGSWLTAGEELEKREEKNEDAHATSAR